MKKLAIPFVIILALIGLALIAYRNGYANEQANAPLPKATVAAPTATVVPTVVHPKASTEKPVNPPGKTPTAAPTKTVTASATHPTANAGKPLATPQKTPTTAPAKTAVKPATHAMDPMTPAAMPMADGHTAAHHMNADHMAADHGVSAEAAAVKNPIPASSESASRGAAIFSQSCTACHGKTGEGDGPAAAGLNPKPADLHADHVQGNSDGALFWIISHGREGTVMPAWNTVFSDEQRWDVVNFLRTFHVDE